MGRVLYLARLRLRRHRLASLVAVLLITIVGGAVLSTLAAGRRTQSAFARLEDQTRVTNGFVGLSEDPQQADAQAAEIVDMPEVDGWARVTLTGGHVYGGAPDAFIGLAFPQDDRVRHDVERPRIVQGRAPDIHAPFEIVMGESRARKLGLRVGDELPLETYTQKQITEELSVGKNPGQGKGPRLSLRLVGLERGPRQVITDQETENDLMPVTPAFLQTVKPLPGAFVKNALIVRVPNEADMPAFVRRVTSTPDLKNLDVQTTNGSRVVDTTDLVARALYAFALISAICGTVALALFFARRASADIGDDDTLAAMGVTRNERRAATVLDLLPAIVIGVMGAIVVAIVVSVWMPFGLAGRIEPVPGLDIDWLVLVPGAAVLFLGCVLLTAAVAWRTIGWHARESRHASFATRLVEGVRARPAPAAGVRMALERGRGARAVPVGLALVGAVLVISGITGALTFGASLRRVLDEPRARGMSWDVQATDPDGKTILADPDVASATLAVSQTITINDTTVEARGLKTVRGEPPAMFIEGRAPNAIDEVALGRKTRRALHVGTGDVVHAAGPAGTFDLRVVGTAVFSGMSDDPALAEGAALTYEALDRIVRSDEGDLGEAGNPAYVVTFASGLDKGGAIDRLNAALNPQGYGVDVPATPAELRRLRDVRRLPVALAIFVGLLGAIAVGYAFVTAVQRRRGDLAMHKALGMTRRGVRVIVLTQATTTVLVGIVLGVPLGLLAARFVWRIQVDNLGARFVVVAPLLALAAVCGGAVVIGNLCSVLPATRAARTRPAVTLRTE
jgi:ABC-type lipoprotein release transport system permease subunit